MSSAALAVRQADLYESWGEIEDDPPAERPALLTLVGSAAPTQRVSSDEPAAVASSADTELRAQFEALADDLLRDGAGVSVPRRLMPHPAYVGILSLGERAIPLLVERLEGAGGRPIWLSLLGSLTGFQPGAGRETVADAAHEWIAWSKSGHRAG